MRGSMFRIPTYRYWLAAVVTAIVVATFTLPWLLTSNVEGADEPTVLFQETAIGVSVGNSITVIVEASGIPVGTDGLQVEISHTARISIVEFDCLGPFATGVAVPATSTSISTVLGCQIIGGDVTSFAGDIISLNLVRVSSGEETLTFGDSGSLRTLFADDGIATDPTVTNSLSVDEGVNVGGRVTLQLRSDDEGASLGHVTLVPGGRTAKLNSDGTWSIPNVEPGTYSFFANAANYLVNQIDDVVVGASDLDLPDTELTVGDINGDGVVSILDISGVASNFGRLEPSAWEPGGPAPDTAIPIPATATPHGAPKPSIWGGTLRLAAHGPPSHFDFYASNTIANIGSQAPMYNKLVRKLGLTTDLPITGDLATHWEISPDSRTYTFFLRDGVKFHDGSDFSAEDVKASYERIIFPQNELVSGRKTNFGAVSEINVVNDLTIEFKLDAPRGPGWMLAAMAHGWNVIVKKETLGANGGNLREVDNHPGTGPFKYVSRNDQRWVQERNEDYWDPSKPNVGVVEHIWLVAWTPELSAALLSGVVDWGMWLDPNLGNDIRDGNIEGLKGLRWTLPNIGGMVFNTTRSPYDDKRVRKALSIVIDQEAINEATKDLRESELGDWFLFGTPFALTPAEIAETPGLRSPTAEDLALAQSLLADAGYPNGAGFPTVTLVTHETPDQEITNAAIQGMIKEGLNLDAEIQLVSQSVHGEKLRAQEFDFSTNAGYTVGLTDPAAYIVAGLGTCGDRPCDQNFGQWTNAAFDDLIVQLTDEPNQVARIDIVNEMRAILLDEWPIMPTGPKNGLQFWGWTENLLGVVPGDFSGHYDLHTWDDVWLLKK